MTAAGWSSEGGESLPANAEHRIVEDAIVGPHDPILLSGMGGIWVECECGWISPSFYTAAGAHAAHEVHLARAGVS